ncbi:hypothetical protein DBV15_08192 [Temnothorax longispinosus]|uniref:Uncharacterized protein n=1 Tax=Temnothorax longispinosus TaxID=300112 RepID=A0A4S2KW02_9HYME|nr:hypothetical protein DBV15_08192 [Temnothorax longispinosus]
MARIVQDRGCRDLALDDDRRSELAGIAAISRLSDRFAPSPSIAVAEILLSSVTEVVVIYVTAECASKCRVEPITKIPLRRLLETTSSAAEQASSNGAHWTTTAADTTGGPNSTLYGKREAEERRAPCEAFPGHVGLMKIHGFSIDAIKSTASLPLPCSSLRRNGNLELFDSESGPDLTLSPQTFTSTAEAFINDNSDSLGVPGDNDTGKLFLFNYQLIFIRDENIAISWKKGRVSPSATSYSAHRSRLRLVNIIAIRNVDVDDVTSASVIVGGGGDGGKAEEKR